MQKQIFRLALRAILMGYLFILIILPISIVFVKGFSKGWGVFWKALTGPIAMDSVWLTLELSFVAMIIQTVIGTIIAFTLVRYRFWGKGFLNSMIDLPFALPTAVSGLMILTIFSPGSFSGKGLSRLGIHLLQNHAAIIIAMVFVTFPFVIRAVQPLLEEMDTAEEEASHTLGAGRGYTFRKVIFPSVLPGVVAGGMLAFSRALAEFGAVSLVSGNLPGKTMVASAYIESQIGSFRLVQASAISMILLSISFIILWAGHAFQKRLVKPS